eukprot:TRINITY_DN1891_c0_g1_i2.p1 TRINITY_DN1891_c0_g1~~TRINITY_DN1891_c0_g1_i2.p1  ORF type:complete len:168 (-),score=15.56 TRINITY_DN1891_c0_g1_i2:83-586(-)
MYQLQQSTFVLLILTALIASCVSQRLKPCPGDTRGDRRCDFDSTHRVCAKIGIPDTSFWHFTGQRNWCNSVGYYWGSYGRMPRCPADKPTWCICKWATARWIAGEGCNNSVQFDCDATDVCNLKASYTDFNVNLRPAHDCMMQKCPEQWARCPEVGAYSSGANRAWP